MLVIVFVMGSTFPVLASSYSFLPTTMQELKQQDPGPDSTCGVLISEHWAYENDGTPYVERIYVKNLPLRASNYAHYTKTKSYGATGSVQVEADFSWNSSSKTAYSANAIGKYNQGGGVSGTRNPRVSTKGNGTNQASASYSIEVNRNLGGWATYQVTLYCDYNGHKS